MTIADPAPGRTGALVRGRQGFRRWRRSRPFWGGLLTAVAGLEVFGTTQMSLEGLSFQLGPTGFLSWVIPTILVACGLLMWFTPQQRMFYAIVAEVTAVFSLIGVNLGGFFIGMVLGIVGGALGFAWAPRRPVDAAGGEAGAIPVADPAGTDSAGTGPGETGPVGTEPVHDAGDTDPAHAGTAGTSTGDAGPDGERGAPGLAALGLSDDDSTPEPARDGTGSTHPAAGDRPSTPGNGRLLAVALLALSLSVTGVVALRTGQAQAAPCQSTGQATPAPGPVPATTRPAPTGPPAGSPTSAVPVLRVAGDGSVSPDPATSTPAGTPTAVDSPSAPAGTDGPSTPAGAAPAARVPGPAAVAPAPATPGTCHEPSPGTPTPQPSASPLPRLDAADGQPRVAREPSRLTGSKLTMSGLHLDGVTELPTATGKLRVLKFSMRRATTRDFRLKVPGDGVPPLRLDSDTLVVEGHVVFYATRFSGRFLGFRITLTPDTPGPSGFGLPFDLSFGDPDIQLAYVQCDRLGAPGLDVRPA